MIACRVKGHIPHKQDYREDKNTLAGDFPKDYDKFFFPQADPWQSPEADGFASHRGPKGANTGIVDLPEISHFECCCVFVERER